ncbi:MAG TPA: hypothetical protein VKZ79_10205 [Alphaproteobacteria bacterium]|nr:hypothetical protein [Alphaproteobacteria bacterium]
MTAAILKFRSAAAPAPAVPDKAATDLVRLFALDRLPFGTRRLVCRWRREADGRLAAHWEPDIVFVPLR